jgi:hypothetical protein
LIKSNSNFKSFKIRLFLIGFVLNLFLIFSCNNAQQEDCKSHKSEASSSDFLTSEKQKQAYRFINDSLYFDGAKSDSMMSFKFNFTADSTLLKSIVIYRGHTIFQNINANKSVYLKNICLRDWNFDGFNDISVLDECGSGGLSYWIWLYNTKSRRFIYNDELSKVWGLEMDSISKYIVRHFRAGAPEESWDTFKIKNDKLIFIKGLYQRRWNSNGENWVCHQRNFIQGEKLIQVEDSFIVK